MTDIILSEVEIIPIKPRNGLLAFCSFVINNSLFVGDVAIYSRLDGSGYRIVYPIKVLSNGLKINCFHPIDKPTGEAIENQIIEAFQKLMIKQRGGNDGRIHQAISQD